jgi:hypothetical protein
MNKIKVHFSFIALLLLALEPAIGQSLEIKPAVGSVKTSSDGLSQQSPTSNRNNNLNQDPISNPDLTNKLSENKIEENNSQENTESKNSTIETVQWDYDLMPLNVQLKINENKKSGKNLLDEIAKGFEVEIKSCIDSQSTNKNLFLLTQQNGVLRVEYVSTGHVKIIVHSDFDSVTLKEMMLSQKLDFNFLSEFYFVNK